MNIFVFCILYIPTKFSLNHHPLILIVFHSIEDKNDSDKSCKKQTVLVLEFTLVISESDFTITLRIVNTFDFYSCHLYIFTAHALISAAELIPAAKSCARDKVFHTLIVETTRRRAAVKVTQDVFAYVYRERTDGCHFKSRINSILLNSSNECFANPDDFQEYY